jgi:hypothetical protein
MVASLMTLMLVMSGGCMREGSNTGEKDEPVALEMAVSSHGVDSTGADREVDLNVGVAVVCETTPKTAKITLSLTNGERRSIAFLPNLCDLQVMPSSMDIVIWDVSSTSFRVAVDSTSLNVLEWGMYEPLVRSSSIPERDLQFIEVPAGGRATIVYVVEDDPLVARYHAVLRHVYADARIPLWADEGDRSWSIVKKNIVARSPRGRYIVRRGGASGGWRVVERQQRRYRVTESEYLQLVESVKARAAEAAHVEGRVLRKQM